MAENTTKTLKQWRGMRGMTQRELSDISGVNERSIVSFEKDVENLKKAKYSTIIKLSTALGIKVGSIFLGDTPEKPKQEVE